MEDFSALVIETKPVPESVMLLYHIVILAIIQGLTEFLPVSSSGHLFLIHEIMGHDNTDWQQTVTMDVAVHVGTLLAVLLYFRADICHMAYGLGKTNPDGRKLLLYVIAGSIPVIVAGFLIHLIEPDWLRSLPLIAWCTLLFGIVLWVADKRGGTTRTVETMTIKDALYIGLSQILALVPGTSRSGITMTAARFLGFDRVNAARFSLLLSVVAISGAGVLGAIDVVKSGNMQFGLDILLAIALSFVSGLLAISLMIKWLQKADFMPFVYYRIILGALLLTFLYL